MILKIFAHQWVFDVSDELEDLDRALAVGPDDDIRAASPANSRHKLIVVVRLRDPCRGRPAPHQSPSVPIKERLDGVETIREQGSGQTLVVEVEWVVLRAAGHVISAGGQAHEILLVHVTLVALHAIVLCGVDVPQLELGIGRGTDNVLVVEEADVAHGLLVAAEHGEGALELTEVVVVDAVVRGPEGYVETAVGVEFDAADVGAGLEGCDGVGHAGGPQLDTGVVRGGREQVRVHAVEVHAPAALLVLLKQ